MDVVAFVVTALAALQAEFKDNAAGYRASNVNLLLWWRDRIETLPNSFSSVVLRTLSPLARMLLAVPASSASDEPVFAAYTNLIEGRKHLGADRADMLLQIQHLLRSSAFTYLTPVSATP